MILSAADIKGGRQITRTLITKRWYQKKKTYANFVISN